MLDTKYDHISVEKDKYESNKREKKEGRTIT